MTDRLERAFRLAERLRPDLQDDLARRIIRDVVRDSVMKQSPERAERTAYAAIDSGHKP